MDFDFSVVCECKLCGNNHEVYLMKEDYDSWRSGDKYIQDALSYLTAGDREILLSLTCDDCWQKLYPFDNEE